MNNKNDDLLETGSQLQSLAERLLEAIAVEDQPKVEKLECDIHALVAEIRSSLPVNSGQTHPDLKTLSEAIRSLDRAVEQFENKPSEEAKDQLDKSLIRLVYARGKRLD